MKAKIPSYFDAGLVARATERAATDAVYSALLDQAVTAGKVAGAAVNNTDASAYWKALGDSLARHGVAMLAHPDDVPSAKELRDLCALVNSGIKAAQSAAKAHALKTFEAAQMADRAKKARDRIVKALTRALTPYALKINFQTAKVEALAAVAESDVADKSADTAKAAVTAGTTANLDAFLDGLCALDPATQKMILARVGASYKKWQEEEATKKVEADRASKAALQEKLNDEKARKEARDVA